MMRFRFTLGELSGALADLGVLLPLTLVMISLNGLNATSAFMGIGLAYLLSAFVYRLPIPVQPLKSLAATAIAFGLGANVIDAGAWWMAAIFLVLAATDAARWILPLFPKPVVRGIQLGLGLLLLRSAWTLWQPAGHNGGFDIWLLAGGVIALGLPLLLRRNWAALSVIAFGVIVVLLRRGLPALIVAPSLPTPTLPALSDLGTALWLLVLPQIPLSLANAVFATEDTARRYFGPEAAHVTPKRLLSTMGVSNCLAALLGGLPICHGSGGLTAHFRLGARTGGAPMMLGIFFLLFGLLGGKTLLPVLQLIPFPILGLLLAYVGVQHALLARDLRGAREWLPTLMVAVVAWFTHNLAIGFAAGIGLYWGLTTQRRWAWRRAVRPQAR